MASGAALIVALAGALAGAAAAPPDAVDTRSGSCRHALAFGHSVQGRVLRAVRCGPARAEHTVLVVGTVHGEERGGRAVTGALRAVTPPARTTVWLVDDANPDGSRAGTRQNSRGVDLNRNFPHRWRSGVRGSRFYPGPRASSEPETRALRGLVRLVRPDVTVWFHQPYAIVVRAGGDRAIQRSYARRTRLPLRDLPAYRGTAIGWQNARFPGTTAFVVELGPGEPSSGVVSRHRDAILSLAHDLSGAGRDVTSPVHVRPN